MTEPSPNALARILVVDDEAPNRRLLHALLVPEGYQVIEASDGLSALAIAAEQRIDLMLLDVMMPGIGGIEVCQRVRANPALAQLPVVFVTALADRASRIAGKAAGADDFLGKPVDEVELLVRVRNLVAAGAKTRRLAELDRFKDEMTALLAHDLRNLLAAITGNLSWAVQQPEVVGELGSALGDARDASTRAVGLIADLLDVPRLEAGRLRLQRHPEELGKLLRALVGQRQHLLQRKSIRTQLDLGEDSVRLAVDVDLLSRVVDNLLDNGTRYTPRGGLIQLGLGRTAETVRITIANNGPAIPDQVRERIFDKYARASAGDTGADRERHGLGLYFCRLAIEAHGGRIFVASTLDWPTQFVIELPLKHG